MPYELDKRLRKIEEKMSPEQRLSFIEKIFQKSKIGDEEAELIIDLIRNSPDNQKEKLIVFIEESRQNNWEKLKQCLNELEEYNEKQEQEKQNLIKNTIMMLESLRIEVQKIQETFNKSTEEMSCHDLKEL